MTATTKSALPEAARSRLGTGARLMAAIPGWMAVCAAAGAVGGAAYRAISPSKRLRGPSEGESAPPPHSAPDECEDGEEEVAGGEKSCASARSGLVASCPGCVGCVTAVAMSATLGECGSKSRCPAPFPSLSVMAFASSPLAGTAVHRLVIGGVVRQQRSVVASASGEGDSHCGVCVSISEGCNEDPARFRGLFHYFIDRNLRNLRK